MVHAQARMDTSAQVGNVVRNMGTVVFRMHIATLVVRQSSVDVIPGNHQQLPESPAQTTPVEESMVTFVLTAFAAVNTAGAAKALVIAERGARVCLASVRKISFLRVIHWYSRYHSIHVFFI
jgi:hypothetical protein